MYVCVCWLAQFMCTSCVYTVYVCVEFYREELCVGEENVEVNYAFFRGEGCIYVCVYLGGWATQTLYVR